eukprot:TRINITY_DN1762_c0_g1_i3.p1 TRINITY_DN1762_c0_g1~~TRINITY_DN1762_c0_g1_i3.p1  ORF type:complete len:279 (-),score=40.42 TRINITY_DN1762_c0_g1_i3:11-847(-)
MSSASSTRTRTQTLVLNTFPAQLAYLNQQCHDIIAARRLESRDNLEQRHDLLSLMLLRQLRSQSGEMTGEEEDKVAVEYCEKDLRDAIMNLLIAGRDTTALLLTWCMYLLSQHPKIEAKVLDEIERELGDSPIDYSNLKRLQYLKQVLQETLRMYPPVPIECYNTREVESVFPGGYYAPPQTSVLYSAYTMHRNPKYYPNPEEFNPDRFATAPAPYTFLPFHAGPRVCLGKEMAYLEAMTMVVTLLRSGIRLRLYPEHRVAIKQAIMLTSDGGMRMVL